MKWPRSKRLRNNRRRPSALSASRIAGEVERLEPRVVLSAAFGVTDLTLLRNHAEFGSVDGVRDDGVKIGIAVIDSGVMGMHPDLRDNFVAFFDAVATDASADDGLTPADTELPSGAFDPDGHGTHIAGIAASANSEIGVAPSAGLIAIRGLASPGESLPRHDSLLSGLRWVEENHERYHIKVVNLSIQNGTNLDGVPNANDFARQIGILENLGIAVVASTGNSYADFATLGASFPAVFASLSVASTWEDNASGDQLEFLTAGQNPQYAAIDADPVTDQIAASSQRSSLANQVAAPGSTIFSTWNDGGYHTLAGTSMAAGFVSGLVALVQDAAYTFGGRYLSVQEAVGVIRDTAETIFDGQSPGTLRAPLVPNEDGSVSMGPAEDLVETERNYRRVNAFAAVTRTRSLLNPSGEGDINKTLATSASLPPLTGAREHSLEGRIGSDGPNLIGPNDVDAFRIVVESPARLRVVTERPAGGQAFDPFLRIFDDDGGEIASQNDSADGGLYHNLLTGPLSPGVYYIGLSSFANVGYDPFDQNSAFGGNSVGDYRLTVSLENPDPDGIVQGAKEVSLSNPNAVNADENQTSQGAHLTSSILNREIGRDSLGELDPTIDAERIPISVGTSDVDFYRVLAPDSGKLFVRTNTTNHGSEGIDTFIQVFAVDSLGNISSIAGNNNAGPSSTDSFLEVDVISGQTYWIAVSASGNESYDPLNPYSRFSSTDETGFYDLHLSFTNGDANGTALGAADFSTMDADRDGIIDEAVGSDNGEPILGDGGGYKDVDFFHVTATQDGLLDVSLLTPETADDPLEGVLGIWELAADRSSIRPLVEQALGMPRAIMEVSAGDTYWISVTGRGNQGFHWAVLGSGTGGDTGDYRLSVQERPASDLAGLADNSIHQHSPRKLPFGHLVTGNIGRDGQTVLGADDVDFFSYTAPMDQMVVIQTSAQQEGDADTFLRVFDAAGHELATNNDSASGTRGSQVSLLFSAGETYYIGVSGNSANASQYNPLTGENAAAGSTGNYTLVVTELPPPIYAAGADAGGGPHVRVFDARTDAEQASFFAYDPLFAGGVRMAVGDVTGDGIDDVVTAPGPGGGPHVRVFDGAKGQFLTGPAFDFFAFHAGMDRGLNVAVGDIDGDGFGDIIVAPDAGASPVVRVFSGKDGSQLRSFFAYDFQVTGGVRVAAGDVNGDGFDDIFTIPGPGSPAQLRVFDGRIPQDGLGIDLLQTSGLRIGNLTAYPGFLGGAYLAAGDVNGDGFADAILGAGAGGGPHVMVYSGSNDGPLELKSFFAYDPGFTGGVRVAASEFRLDRRVEIVTAPGPGGGPHVRIFDAQDKFTDLSNNFPFGQFPGGVFVAGSGSYRPLEEAQRLAAGSVSAGHAFDSLTLTDLAAIRDAAIARLAGQGLNPTELQTLENVQFALSDLPGDLLGLAFHNTVLLDTNAARAGWYLDPTPLTDEEFTIGPRGDLLATDSRVQGVDLLSVILHELGHHLGGDDLDAELHPNDLMADAIAPARRRVPQFLPLDAVYADDGFFGELLETETLP